VQQDVQAAKPLVQGVAEGVQPGRLGQIQGDKGRPPPGPGEDLVIQGFQRALGPGRGDDVGAGVGEGESRSPTYAP